MLKAVCDHKLQQKMTKSVRALPYFTLTITLTLSQTLTMTGGGWVGGSDFDPVRTPYQKTLDKHPFRRGTSYCGRLLFARFAVNNGRSTGSFTIGFDLQHCRHYSSAVTATSPASPSRPAESNCHGLCPTSSYRSIFHPSVFRHQFAVRTDLCAEPASSCPASHIGSIATKGTRRCLIANRDACDSRRILCCGHIDPCRCCSRCSCCECCSDSCKRCCYACRRSVDCTEAVVYYSRCTLVCLSLFLPFSFLSFFLSVLSLSCVCLYVNTFISCVSM